MPHDAILPVYAPPVSPCFERGEGVRLFTDAGEAYLDFISGIAVTGLGHAHPHLVRALVDQAGRLWHVSNMMRIKGQEQLASRLVAASFAERVFFTNSGAEAIECALKLARHHHHHHGRAERATIISFEGSFHGRTLAAVNAGAAPAYREGFGPPLPGFRHVPFADGGALRRAVAADTAAILIEPVQGEGGLRCAPPGFLAELRALCDERGCLLIYDEVQCGCGRTGRLFAHEWAEQAAPDIMAVAKGIGGGFPLGACLVTEKVAKGMAPGKHGSTYGGNPLAMAVGNAVWDVLTGPGFLDRVRNVAEQLREGLEALRRRHPSKVLERRGKGLLTGLRLAGDPMAIRAAALRRRLLIGTASDQTIRLAPPLIMSGEDVDEAVGILDRCLIEFEPEPTP